MIEVRPFHSSMKMKIIYLVFIVTGILALRLQFIQNENRAWFIYLIGSIFFLALGLGALFFVAINFLTSAKWVVSSRRVLETMTLTLPIAALLFVGVFMGLDHLYSWTDAAGVAADPVLTWKSAFLNSQAFGIRLIAYFAIWILGAFWMFRNSLKQDITGEVKISKTNWRFSAFFLVFYALSVCLAGFDILMSLEPHWFSTIFGIYFFAGAFEASLAMYFILSYILYRAGTLRDVLTVDHFHDMSRFIFGFAIFWAYIGFSQFMLIWYGNLPEETFYYKVRIENGWACWSVLLPIVRFGLPFIILLPYAFKRSFKIMLPICILVLLGEWLDLFWMAAPTRRLIEHAENLAPALNWKEVLIGLGFVSLFMMTITLIMERVRMIPARDPRLEASIHYYHH